MLFTCDICVSLREGWGWVRVLFFIKFQIFFGAALEFIFVVKVLKKDLLTSLMIRRVLALCFLYLFRFSDKGFVLNFLMFSCFCTSL